ncbi:MAG: hypothetical protein ACT4O4_00295 [Nitrospiraceae bacterium]
MNSHQEHPDGVARYVAGMMRLAETETRYVLVLRAGVVMTCVLLGVLILTCSGLNTLGEPFGDHLMAISIAISRLAYGVEGLAGLEQVLDTLRQIPSVSLINLDSAAAREDYQSTINETIQRAAHVDGINLNQLHAYVNEQAYLYYVIAAFDLFGIKIQSLSYLWLSILFASVASFLAAYREKIQSLLLLWCMLVAILLVVIANPGVGSQLLTVYNYRFLPVLGLIPLLHIMLSMNDRQKDCIGWAAVLIQLFILASVLLMRGSAQWMLAALALAAVYSLWSVRRELRAGTNGRENMLPAGIIASRMAPFIFILVILLLAKSAMPRYLHKEYEGELWARSHVIWHAAFVGMTTDPVLMRRYVCSNEPLTDQLMNFGQVPCNEEPRRYPRLMYGIFQQPSDMHGFHAAVRYLREQGSEEQIGLEVRRPGYFNIRWDRYDEIVGKIYFDMLRENPVDSLYMYAIVKPLRYLKEAAMYATYFGRGLSRSQGMYWIFGGVAAVFTLHCLLVRGFRQLLTRMQSHRRNEAEIPPGQLLVIFLASLAPSIVFYSQSHTIADSVAVLLALGLALPITLTSVRTSSEHSFWLWFRNLSVRRNPS